MTERANIGGNFGRAFLEHHEHARFAKLRRPVYQEFDGEHGLARPRAAADESRAAGGQPAAGDFIKALDAGGGLGQLGAGGDAHFLQSPWFQDHRPSTVVAVSGGR